MLQKTHAVRALQDGCRRLGLPNSTAAALLQFLSVKRTHDQFVPEQDQQLRMSPGATLDKLWHYMLLNTTVSSCVHALLGGGVDHRGTDAWDLADDAKLLQRLYALNVLRLEGHDPDVALWTEPGTALHTLHLTTSAVPGLRPLPGGGRLYITPSLSKQQLDQLVNALEALYAKDTQDTQPQKMPGAAAAQQSSMPEPAAAMAAAAKRRRTDQLQQQLSQQSPSGSVSVIRLLIREQLGLDVQFSVKPNTKMEKVMKAYVEQKSLDFSAVKFMFDGNRLQPHHTPEDYEMEDGEVIDCIEEHVGC